jgi:hypothetical protein
MITCEITDIVQGFDLQRKEQRTYAVLVLPGGKQVQVPVSEDDAAAIISIAMSEDTPTEYKAPPAWSAPPEKKNGAFTPGIAPDGTEALVFGDQVGAQEAALADEVERKIGGLPSLEEEMKQNKIPTQPIDGGPPSTASKIRARLVGVDAKGNPIMQYPNGVDPQQVIGGPSANADEDGVQQL